MKIVSIKNENKDLSVLSSFDVVDEQVKFKISENKKVTFLIEK